jgi:uncharacterized protein YyaL (SSP411 family)
MEKVASSVLFIFLICSSFSANHPAGEKIQWISFEEAEKKLAEKELPVLVDIYTDWCGWCKVMDQKTYSKSIVAGYLNSKFYAVKFNAESKQPITWRGKVYKYNPEQKLHSLAKALITGEMGFPNTVFIANKQADPQSIAGYLTPKDLQVFVTYFGESKNREVDFNTYARNFKPNW